MILICLPNIRIKQPKTHKEQLDILKQRNLVITNEKEALSFLERVNYDRFSAYGLVFKKEIKMNLKKKSRG